MRRWRKMIVRRRIRKRRSKDGGARGGNDSQKCKERRRGGATGRGEENSRVIDGSQTRAALAYLRHAAQVVALKVVARFRREVIGGPALV